MGMMAAVNRESAGLSRAASAADLASLPHGWGAALAMAAGKPVPGVDHPG